MKQAAFMTVQHHTAMKDNTIFWLIGGGALAYYLYNKSQPAATTTAPAVAAPILPMLQQPMTTQPAQTVTASNLANNNILVQSTQAPAAPTPPQILPVTQITPPTVPPPVNLPPANIITTPYSQPQTTGAPVLILPMQTDETLEKFLNKDYPQ